MDLSDNSLFTIISQGSTHPGNKRAGNQDAFLCNNHCGVWVVADGMGGHESGDIASQTVIQSIANLTQIGGKKLDVLTITSVLEDVNEQLYKQNTDNGRIMGSTVALVVADGQHATCLWAGDSRIYLLRGNRLMQLSTDHSYVQELKNRGTFLDAATINRKSNIITRAVGVNKDLKFDYREVLLELGDKILLCSDGLYNELSHEEIAAILNYSEDIKLAAKQLLELCLSREAKDNISFILLEVQL